MSLTFYFAPMSTATVTQLVFAELGTPHEAVHVDLQKKESHKADFLAKNPNGRVPTIVHDGTSIWESSAITMYLGEQFGVDKGLYPAPGPRRGEAMKWIAWCNVTLGEAVNRFTRNTMDWFPVDQHNAKAGEAAKQDIATCLKIVDEALDQREFLLGDYSLVDTHLNGFMEWLRMLKLDFSPFARLNAWSDRCRARPAFAQVMSQGAG
jgi:glutathione S-transferase